MNIRETEGNDNKIPLGAVICKIPNLGDLYQLFTESNSASNELQCVAIAREYNCLDMDILSSCKKFVDFGMRGKALPCLSSQNQPKIWGKNFVGTQTIKSLVG
jgi:hypothetical protein